MNRNIMNGDIVDATNSKIYPNDNNSTEVLFETLMLS